MTETRIVILGKPGAGKSSLANTIFKFKELEKYNKSSKCLVLTFQSQTKSNNLRGVSLIDTPGLFDTDQENTDLSSELLKNKCVPGPDAFLLVLKVERFTKHEKSAVDKICKYFSEEALKYTTVVFTHGDDLPEGMKIEEWVSHNEVLRELLWKCGGRCHVFDNKHWNNTQDQYRNNNVQVEELLNTIDSTVRQNEGGYYLNVMLKHMEHEIQSIEEHNLLEEKIEQKVANFFGTNSCNVM